VIAFACVWCSCAGTPAPKYDRASASLRVELGACAAQNVSFVSGEREYDELRGGLGTIDTGIYGTIGHSPRIGGVGSIGGTTLTIGQPSVVGDLDKAIIRRYVKRNAERLEYCYEKQLLVRPGLAGTAVVQFFIKPDGQVSHANASGVDPDVDVCMAEVIRNIEFPKPKNGAGVQVSYPFTFRPPTRAHPDNSPAPPDRPEPELAHEVASPKPPVDNPFDARRAELADCLRREPEPYGVIVVDLGFEPHGAVTSATTSGLAGDDARACVARVARTIVKANAPASQRCAIAFGTMHADHLPGIEVASDTIKADHRPIARLGDTEADASAGFERVVGALNALVADPSPAPPIAIRGPIVLRAIDIAPMKLVNIVLAAAFAANVRLEPAVLRDGDWRLLHASRTIPEVPIAQPVAELEPGAGEELGPTELRQGGAFATLTGTGDLGGFDLPTTIDVLVTATAIHVPTDDTVVEVADVAAFAERVSKLAHGVWPEGAVVTLAARGDVKFGMLARAIEVVERAGLRWRITTPKE